MCTMHSKCQCLWGFFVSSQITDKKTISQLVWLFIIRQLATTALIFMHGYHCKTQDLIILFSLMNHQFLQALCVAATKWYTDLSYFEFFNFCLLPQFGKRLPFPHLAPQSISLSPTQTRLHFCWVSKFWKASDTLQFLLQNILRHGISKDLLRISLLWTGMKGRYREKPKLISQKWFCHVEMLTLCFPYF